MPFQCGVFVFGQGVSTQRARRFDRGPLGSQSSHRGGFEAVSAGQVVATDRLSDTAAPQDRLFMIVLFEAAGFAGWRLD